MFITFKQNKKIYLDLTRKATLKFCFASVSWPNAAHKKVTNNVKAQIKTLKCLSHSMNITVTNHHRINNVQ